MTKKQRQQEILEIISARQISTQEELTSELSARGFAATQPSVSRDIVELGIVKADGYYTMPSSPRSASGPVLALDTAGDHLIVVRTEIGQAQHAGLMIDRAKFAEIVGTVAGDDTIMVAVKGAAAQRVAIKKIIKLFQPKPRMAATPSRRKHRRARAPVHL